jgi:hypothetical protein
MTGRLEPAPPDYLAAARDLPSVSLLALAAAAQVLPWALLLALAVVVQVLPSPLRLRLAAGLSRIVGSALRNSCRRYKPASCMD